MLWSPADVKGFEGNLDSKAFLRIVVVSPVGCSDSSAAYHRLAARFSNNLP